MSSNVQEIQRLGKRKLGETDFENSPVIFGIVTTGILWRFIRVTGPLGSQKVEITAVYNSGLGSETFSNMQGAKDVLSHIVRVLQAQAQTLRNNAKRSRNN